jgi:hypothetical protein
VAAISRRAQRVTFHQFGRKPFVELLRLQPPTIPNTDPQYQLRFIESYLRKIGCGCVVLEHHYVDRDYIEDHSALYSRDLFEMPNYCRRLHFFKGTPGETRRGLTQMLQIAGELSSEDYTLRRRNFSRDNYLGFSAIRFLPGAPVGRTVLTSFGPVALDGGTRRFDCTRIYHAHLLGVELSVLGLAFQQQDAGVSACATTALWSSLSKVRDFEDFGSATPLQITSLASRHSLPFGRAMPSAGLSVDQMCQAVHGVGISPELLNLDSKDKNNVVTSRSYLYSATQSGFAPVLIIARPGEVHAVTAVGMKTRDRFHPSLASNSTYDRAYDLEAVYVHDDRVGPGVLAELAPRGNVLKLRLRVFHETGFRTRWETWALTSIIVPLHNKIRFSFAGLQDMSVDVAAGVNAARRFYAKSNPPAAPLEQIVIIDNWIARAPPYLEQLRSGIQKADARRVQRLARTVRLPRYVGVIRVTARGNRLDPIDVLVDTTTTIPHRHALGVFPLSAAGTETSLVAGWLSRELGCPVIAARPRRLAKAARHQPEPPSL